MRALERACDCGREGGWAGHVERMRGFACVCVDLRVRNTWLWLGVPWFYHNSDILGCSEFGFWRPLCLSIPTVQR